MQKIDKILIKTSLELNDGKYMRTVVDFAAERRYNITEIYRAAEEI